MTRGIAKQIQFAEEGDFEAYRAATKWLKDRGFSHGSGQRGEPSGILLGDIMIAKWKNLSLKERLDLHGKLTGDHRYGPVTVTIFDDAPAEAIAAANTPKGISDV